MAPKGHHGSCPAENGIPSSPRQWPVHSTVPSGQRPRANSCGSAACSGCGGVWTTTEVEARRPRTNGQLLRLGGLQCVSGGTANNCGRGAVAMDQGPTSVAQGPAVGGLGDAGCPMGRGAAARHQGATPAAQRLAKVRYRYLGRRRYGQDHRQLLHLTGEVSGRKIVTKSKGRGTTQFTPVWSGQMYQMIHGGIK